MTMMWGLVQYGTPVKYFLTAPPAHARVQKRSLEKRASGAVTRGASIESFIYQRGPPERSTSE